MDDEKVTVSKSLLTAVLQEAEANCYSTESEFACNAQDSAQFQAERERIAELRAQAGISEDDTVVGRGFFGAAIALSDKPKT